MADKHPLDGAPYAMPLPPFRVDDDGHVVDSNGWLVALPADGVWPDQTRTLLAHAICAHLNSATE